MSLQIDIPVGMDLGEVQKALNQFEGDIEAAAKYLEKLTKGVSGDKRSIFLNFEGEDRTKAIFKAKEAQFAGLEKGAQKLAQALQRETAVEKGSVASIRATVAALKQKITQTNASSASYNELQAELREYTALLNQAQGIQRGSVAELRQQAAEVQRLADAYRIGSKEQKRYQAQLDQINAKIRGSSGPFAGFLGALNKVATFQSGFIAIASGIQGITSSLNQFINQAKQIESFELALKNVGLGAGEASAALREASQIADELGAPVQQVEKSFKRMVPALRAVGTSSKDSSRFIEAIAARTQTLGLNTEQSGRFLEAFAQVLSKGKLQAEELNQQISELDGSFRVQLAEALGVATDELEDLISAGEITADKFVKAVNRMNNGVDELKRRVESGNFTIQQLQNLINNLQIQNLRNIGAALEPGIKAFFDIGKISQEFIANLTKSDFGKFLIESINGIIIGLRNFVVILTKSIEALLKFLDPIFALVRALNNLLSPIGGVVGLLTTLAAAYVSALAVQKAYNIAQALSLQTWKALGAPIAAATKAVYAYIVALKAQMAAENASGISGLISSFGGIKKGARGAAKSTKKFSKAANGFTNVAYGATSSAAEMALALKGGGPELLGLKAGAEGAAAATGGLTVGMIAAGAAIAGVVGVAAILYANFKYTQDAAKALDGATKGLTDTLKELNKDAVKTPGFWEKVGAGLAATGRDIARFFGSEGALIDGAKRAYKDYESNVAKAFVALTELGLNVYNLDSIQSANNKTLGKAVKVQQEVVTATEESIKVTEELIKKAKEQGDLDLAKEYEKQLAELKDKLPFEQAALKNLKTEVALRKLQASATDEAASSLEELNDQRERESKYIDTAKLEAQTAALKRYGNTADDNARLAAANLGIETAASEQRVKNLQQELKEIKRLQTEKAGDAEALLELNKRQSEANQELAQAQNDLAKNQRALGEAVISEFERVLTKQGEFSAKYKEIANQIQSGIDGIRQSGSQALGSLQQLSDTVFQAEIDRSPEGSIKRKQLVEQQLRMQVMIGRIQDQIDRARLASAYRISQLEIQTTQLKLKGEADLARLRGDDKTAAILTSQISAYDEIARLRTQQFNVDKTGLNIQTRLREEGIFQKALQEDIGMLTGQRWMKERDISQRLGIQKTSVEDIYGYYNQLSRSVANTATAEKKRDSALSSSVEEQKKARTEASNAVNEYKNAFHAAISGADGLVDRLRSVKSAASESAKEVARIARIVSGGGSGFVPARWMGGPVSAGQTYRVNDAGLGREAFLSASGGLRMLPAASNINWTAPSSGTIIPAAMVRQMNRNADYNAKLTAANPLNVPTMSASANRAISLDSGNLVKQMTTAMSAAGGNQRITNHVTIQSQEPVTDASKIMTNVARMRLRNSRRI